MPTILVADDEPLIAALIAHVLGPDYRVLSARDGFAAVDLIGRERPDLVILDVRMPGLGGVEVCEFVKADLRTRAIPVLALTVSRLEADRERMRAAGADAFLTKPFGCAELTRRVEGLLGRTGVPA